jgi:4-carboxymuconolactone decarboxylase
MTLLDPKPRTQTGQTQQDRLLGGWPALEPQTPLEASLRDFVFAEIWTRPGLDLRSRYLIAISGASNADTPPEILEGYIKGALTLKELSLAELREAALHYAVYAGWSRGHIMDGAITRAADALGLAPASFPPIRAEPWNPAARQAEGGANFSAVMTLPTPPPNCPYYEGGILNFVFGEMWRRPGLDERARRWVTLVGVSDSSSDLPIRSHIYAAMKSGNASFEEMNEFVLQYSLHGGWPKGSVIQGALFEMAEHIKNGRDYRGNKLDN